MCRMSQAGTAHSAAVHDVAACEPHFRGHDMDLFLCAAVPRSGHDDGAQELNQPACCGGGHCVFPAPPANAGVGVPPAHHRLRRVRRRHRPLLPRARVHLAGVQLLLHCGVLAVHAEGHEQGVHHHRKRAPLGRVLDGAAQQPSLHPPDQHPVRSQPRDPQGDAGARPQGPLLHPCRLPLRRPQPGHQLLLPVVPQRNLAHYV
mmetsp:Transcript_48434/g.90188  ORF Transcript_48434/g.90188 Transcript_48434/m.90188 type:complete len:203 (+) Transcript_48434:847-1455(+)